MGTQLAEGLTQVRAPLIFSAPQADRPVRYIDAPADGNYDRAVQDETHTVEVRDMRPLIDGLSLDVEGYDVLRGASALRDFTDDARIRSLYYPETQELVRQAAGATRVIAFDHNVRHGSPDATQSRVRGPAKRVHNDYTLESGPRRAREVLEEFGLDQGLLKHRFAIVNLWRPIAGPVQESPLAICDARTIGLKDFVATDLSYRLRTGEIYSVTHSPGQRWYYVPRMRTDEALLLKCYDSATDGTARFTAHGAFDDPTSPAGAAPRQSIEVRTLVLFAPNA